jgi:hypothetical protein
MSLAFRTKRLVLSDHATSLPPFVSTPHVTHVAEAPERGDLVREAPESRVVHRAEAPDAGEGRAALLEQEFTHGRSQS